LLLLAEPGSSTSVGVSNPVGASVTGCPASAVKVAPQMAKHIICSKSSERLQQQIDDDCDDGCFGRVTGALKRIAQQPWPGSTRLSTGWPSPQSTPEPRRGTGSQLAFPRSPLMLVACDFDPMPVFAMTSSNPPGAQRL
jgi:hypothetical protein